MEESKAEGGEKEVKKTKGWSARNEYLKGFRQESVDVVFK